MVILCGFDRLEPMSLQMTTRAVRLTLLVEEQFLAGATHLMGDVVEFDADSLMLDGVYL